MSKLPPIECFETNTGVRIYRIPMIVFPNGFVGFSNLILNGGPPILIDTGSGFGDSNQHLLQGITAIRDDFGESVNPEDIDSILITHGHIDHSGGVSFIVEKTGAKIGIHPLDRRGLTNYEERIIMVTKDLRIYLERAGVDKDRLETMVAMHGFAKSHMRSVPVEIDLDDGLIFHDIRIIHTPGHCPGQICILIGDILLSGDHVLAHTTPHQAPESITHYTGLGHYKESLQKIARVDGIRLAIGGHEEPIADFYTCVQDILDGHERKLNRVLDIVREMGRPSTIDEITQTMYPDKTGYETLLAIEEAGAHVEYLYQHGALSVCNLDEVERENNPALRYCAT